MKLCPNCSKENDDSVHFCMSCGTNLAGATSSGGGGWDNATQASSAGSSRPTGYVSGGNSVFVDQGEVAVATIGNGFLQNFLMGGRISRGIGVLTQKRFYYKGKSFGGTLSSFKSSTREGVVDIQDISYSELIYVRRTGLLVCAVLLFFVGLFQFYRSTLNSSYVPICILFLLLAVILLILYFVRRQTLFIVSFPGGAFGFNIRWYPIADVRNFQRQLFSLKDQLRTESAEVAV